MPGEALLRVDVVSVFPDYFQPLGLSLVGKARAAGLLDIRVHDLRDWAHDRHRTVDDTPYGGGAGMVMMPTVWGEALDEILFGQVPDGGTPVLGGAAPSAGSPQVGPADGGVANDGDGPASGAGRPAVSDAEGDAVSVAEGPASDTETGQGDAVLVLPSPSGTVFTEREAEDLATRGRICFACGRYEGIDARVARHYRGREGVEVRELSIGDYVLAGGEVAALAMIEAVARLVPGVLGNAESLVEESHGAAGLLEYPLFTKPPTWRGLEVPEILLSGDHGKVAAWRRGLAEDKTRSTRPDMWARYESRPRP